MLQRPAPAQELERPARTPPPGPRGSRPPWTSASSLCRDPFPLFKLPGLWCVVAALADWDTGSNTPVQPWLRGWAYLPCLLRTHPALFPFRTCIPRTRPEPPAGPEETTHLGMAPGPSTDRCIFAKDVVKNVSGQKRSKNQLPKESGGGRNDSETKAAKSELCAEGRGWF